MKTAHIYLIFLFFLLVSCQSVTPDPSIIHAAANSTLTAMPSATAYPTYTSFPPLSTHTPDPSIIHVAVNSTLTAMPSATAYPTYTSFPPSSTPTPDPTDLKISMLTPSVTITNTLSPTPIFNPTFNLSTMTAGSGSVSRSNPGPYHDGDVVQLKAAADIGWSFDRWTGDLTGIENPITITMNGNKIVTANFIQNVKLPKDLVVDPGTLREDFESMGYWDVSGTAPGYSAEIDNTNYRVGTRSIKLTTPVGGIVRMTKSVNWDLSAPVERGNLRLWVYVYGAKEPANFQILLSNDAGFQNYFIAWYGGGIEFQNRPGWNLVNLRTSDWNVGDGLPSWANPIVRIRFRFDGTTADSYSLDGLSSGVIAQPAVLFTFDDGLSSLFTQAYSYMKTRNVRGTGYIVTDWVNSVNQATWPQLQEMYAAGWTIGSHTKTHPQLPLLSETAQEAELMGARTAFNEHGMTNVNFVGYPHGEYDLNTLTAMANLGMRNGRTLLTGNLISPVVSPFEIPQREVVSSMALTKPESWVDAIKNRQEILVVVFHDISAVPVASSDDWSIANLQSFVDYCIQQGVPIITMDDLYGLQTSSVSIPRTR